MDAHPEKRRAHQRRNDDGIGVGEREPLGMEHVSVEQPQRVAHDLMADPRDAPDRKERVAHVGHRVEVARPAATSRRPSARENPSTSSASLPKRCGHVSDSPNRLRSSNGSGPRALLDEPVESWRVRNEPVADASTTSSAHRYGRHAERIDRSHEAELELHAGRDHRDRADENEYRRQNVGCSSEAGQRM